ncbi:MAG: hypothetical protein R6V59_09210 [Dehalococcoidia bacterium]
MTKITYKDVTDLYTIIVCIAGRLACAERSHINQWEQDRLCDSDYKGYTRKAASAIRLSRGDANPANGKKEQRT